MEMPSRLSATGESLRGYSGLLGLGHSPDRLAQLAPEVAAILDRLAKTWEMDLGMLDMAVGFTVREDDEQ
jgi:hypothetical protein